MIPFNSFHSQPHSPSKSSSIFARFFGLSGAITEHLLDLFSLASLEAGQLFKRTLFSLILLAITIFALFIAYLSFLATIIITAIFHFHIDWLLISGTLTLAHLVIAGVLMILIRHQYCKSSPFEMTAIEIKRDFDALSSK